MKQLTILFLPFYHAPKMNKKKLKKKHFYG